MEPSTPSKARIETDRFCGDCGYNLNTQAVWRDERLGILLCRCPECGRHHPAESNVTMAQDWLRRLTSLVAVVWMLGVVVFLSLVMLVTTAVASNLTSSWELERLEQAMESGTRERWIEFVAGALPFFVVMMIGSWTFVGVINLLASHVRARRLWPAALVPPGLSAGVVLAFTEPTSSAAASPAYLPMVLIVAAVTGVPALASYVLARSIWRGLVLILLPPRVRMGLLGLWTSDGREMPRG
jgi:hypothetical protein